MNLYKKLLLFTHIIIYPVLMTAQNKVVIDDRAGLLNSESVSLLSARFANDNLELTQNVDFTVRCEYWFATLTLVNNEYLVNLKDCNDKITGQKNLGSSIGNASPSDRAMLVYFSLSDIIKNPSPLAVSTPSNPSQGVQTAAVNDSVTSVSAASEHSSRYFFAPSAFNLEKGELYYNTIYFFVHDVQYGITDRFSIGMGTTIAGFPFYVTPKITLPFNDKSQVAFGDMLILGTWNSDFFGNLMYLTYTRGDYLNNASFGGGFLYTNKSDITFNTNSFVLNFSGLARISDHVFFITENYGSRIKSNQTAYYNFYDPISGFYEYDEESFSQRVFFIYGLIGFRFINKKEDIKSWQLGLSYIYTSMQDIPSNYQQVNWSTSTREGSQFITFPVVGYTRKFGKKY